MKLIIITAARVVAQKSPLLIDKVTLDLLPQNCVLIDLSSGEGGSIELSKEDQVVHRDRDISIINVSGYPKNEPRMASEAFAQGIVKFLFSLDDINKEQLLSYLANMSVLK